MTVKSIEVVNGSLITIKEETPVELVITAAGGLLAIFLTIKRFPRVKYRRWYIAGTVLQIGMFVLRHVVIGKKFLDAER